MATAYDKRYTDEEKQRLKVGLQLEGIGPTADKWGINAGIAFRDFAARLVGHAVPYSTKFAQADSSAVCDDIVAAMFRLFESQKAEISRLRQVNQELQAQISAREKRIKIDGLQIMRYLSEAKG